MAQQIQLRRDTAANWTATNPTLASGEVGIETDTGKMKIGNGSTAWVSLAYFAGTGGGSGPTIQGSGTYTQNSGTIQFSNSNGVSFGLSSNGVMTGSVATNYQSQGAYLTTAMASNAGSNFVGLNSALTANGVSATINSSGVSLNFPAFLTTADLSQNSSKYAGINGAITGGSITMNTSGVSINLPAYLTTAQPVGAYLTTADLSQNSSKYAGINGAITGGSITLNTSGVSINLPAYLTTAQPVGAYLTTAMSSNRGSDFLNVSGGFSGTNISGTLASNGLQLSVAAPGGGGGVAMQGSGTYTQNTGTIQFNNSNGVTFGLSNNGVMTASVAAAGGAQTGISGIAGSGASTVTVGTVQFANGNNVTFGLNGNTMTASASYPAQTAFVFSNSNGVSFGTNGSTITATVATNYQSQGAYLTTAMASNAGSNFVGLNSAVTGASLTVNSSGISINVPAAAPSPVNISAGTFSNNLGSIIFANSNGVSFGLGSGASSQSITASVNAGAGGGIAISAGGSNFTSGTVSLGNFGNISHITSNGSIIISETPRDYVNGWSLGGNTAGTNASAFTTEGSLYLVGGNNITLSGNSNSITIVGAAGGAGAGATNFLFQPEVYGNTLTSTNAVGTVYLRPFEMGNAVDVDKYMFQQSLVSLSSTRSLSGGVSGVINTGGTGSFGVSGTILMFSRVNTDETNASYNSIVTFDSKSYSIGAGYTISQTQSTNVSSASVSFSTTAGVSFISNINGAGGFTTGFVTTSGTGSFSSTSTGAGTFGSSFGFAAPYSYLSGIRPLWVPGAGSNMPNGEYWIGMIQSTGTGSTGSYSMQAVAQMSTPAFLYFTASSNNYLEIGSSVAMTTSNWRAGFGSYSASSNTTANIPLSQISNMASNASIYFALQGQTK